MLDHCAFVVGKPMISQLISQWRLVRAQPMADKVRQAVWRGTGCARSTGKNTQRRAEPSST